MLLILPKKKEKVEEVAKVFADLCYRGVHYSKWVILNSIPVKDWKLDL